MSARLRHLDPVEFRSVDGWVLAKYDAIATERCHPSEIAIVWNGCGLVMDRRIVRRATAA